MNLLDTFIEICKKLNSDGIFPTLMGSLGFELVSKENWNPSDIDIHVPGDQRGWEAPDELRIYQWDKIYQLMTDLGYELIDLHEHEFKKNNVFVEFGTINSLEDFAGIKEEEIELIEMSNVKFRLPNLEQYLAIYKASSLDSYRNDQNNRKDFEKISWIENKIKEGDVNE
ncbi:TPA: phosphoribosylanthranilate isomerase [Streptococcus suis]